MCGNVNSKQLRVHAFHDSLVGHRGIGYYDKHPLCMTSDLNFLFVRDKKNRLNDVILNECCFFITDKTKRRQIATLSLLCARNMINKE